MARHRLGESPGRIKPLARADCGSPAFVLHMLESTAEPTAAPTPPPRWRQRAVWLLLVAACLAALLWASRHWAWPWPDVAWLQAHQAQLLALTAARPWATGAALFGLFTVLSALALPGCSVLALAAGLCLGWLPGTLLVALASSVGATLSFLATRHLARDRVRRRWGHRLAGVDAGLARDGAFYLFMLRLAPVIPYPLINPLMGLSAMPVRQFFGVSLLGMLAGSAAYVYAGTALGSAQRWQDLLSPGLWAAAGLLLALPVVARHAWRVRQDRRGRQARRQPA